MVKIIYEGKMKIQYETSNLIYVSFSQTKNFSLNNLK